MRKPDHEYRLLQEIAARVLPGSGWPVVAPTESGSSTPVYRIQRSGTTLYLRLAETPEASLAPEVLVHDLLRARSVRVPEVVHFESFHQELGRSVMVTTAIPGRSLAADHQGIDVAPILAAAGRDLAVINSVAVAGFGFIRRDQLETPRLAAEAPSLRAFALADMESHLVALPVFLAPDEIEAIRSTIARCAAWLDAGQATLAHGDLDATHIYHQDGRYTGIIDFGEIRGADALYDLGHVALHDGEAMPASLLPPLLAGYGEASPVPLPLDYAPRIQFWSLLIGVRALARNANRPQAAYQTHLTQAIRQNLAGLAT
jgi:aminoglycoside phosphotransferase (APT) family kinase protein